jgi:hypothetical protein
MDAIVSSRIVETMVTSTQLGKVFGIWHASTKAYVLDFSAINPNTVVPFIRKSWQSLRRQAAVARSV